MDTAYHMEVWELLVDPQSPMVDLLPATGERGEPGQLELAPAQELWLPERSKTCRRK